MKREDMKVGDYVGYEWPRGSGKRQYGRIIDISTDPSHTSMITLRADRFVRLADNEISEIKLTSTSIKAVQQALAKVTKEPLPPPPIRLGVDLSSIPRDKYGPVQP